MPRECAVTKAYKELDDAGKDTFRFFIAASISSSAIAQGLTKTTQVTVDHMAVDHFRRKLKIGKVKLDELG